MTQRDGDTSPRTHVSVPRRFLEEFIKALDFHNGHGTPSIERASAIVLEVEAKKMLAALDGGTKDSGCG